MGHAKPLLLVDDKQSQIVKNDVSREQSVCADQDIHLACFQGSQHLLLLSRTAEPAQHLDANRKRRHAAPKCLVVLENQNRGGREHGHLFGIGHSLEGRAHRHLSFSISHVAAKKAIHGRRGFHIAFYIGNRRRLVGRL